MELRFAVLGPVRAWRDGVELRLGPPTQQALLALLLVRAGQPVPLAEIVDVLWGEDPPASAVNVVHRHVGLLRRLLEPSLATREPGRWLVRAAGGYRLDVPPDAVDLLRFRTLRERSRREPEAAAGLLLEALELWSGPAAAGVDHPVFTELDRERRDAVADAVDAALRAGSPDAVLPGLRRAVAADPLDEPLQARLVRMLAAAGRQAAALEAYGEARDRLAGELGVDPGPELRAAYESVLRPVAPAEPYVRPAQLPPDLPTFTGRQAELARAAALLPDRPGTVVVTAVGGMAGIGKTALAVHWAHRIADRFPDGQLYVNLRGFEPTGEPAVDPADAVLGFLDTLGVPPGRVPAGLGARTALFRSIVADRRLLVLLDNARDTAQVRPLLPGGSGCLVLVTSRDRLTGLVAVDGAVPLPLDLLPPAEARDFLDRRLGRDRTGAEPGAVAEILAACGGLPLALAIVAAQAVTRPSAPLAGLVAGLDSFSGDEPASDLRAVFSWSYAALSPAAAGVFRLLGLHLGPDVSSAAAASLTGLPAAELRPLLAELADAQLMTEPAPDRWVLHDLVRAYAAELAGSDEAAVGRLLDHYLHSAEAGAQLLSTSRAPLPLDPPRSGVVPERPADHTAALEWAAVQHPAVLAALQRADSDAYVWRLALATEPYLSLRRSSREVAPVLEAGLAAAERDGDRTAIASLHRHLVFDQTRARAFDAVDRHAAAGLALLRELGDPVTEAHLERHLALSWELREDYRESLRHSERAIELYRAADDRAGLALALNMAGWSRALLGEYAAAVEACGLALELQRELGQTYYTAATLDRLGYAYHHLGDLDRAAASYLEALGPLREYGDEYGVALVELNLGDTLVASGDPAAARSVWAHAEQVFIQLERPEVEKVRDRLASVAGK
ncbi:MAG TPA: BTAD domain-containing putative transcriptional regulator [Mycobacteriales bacterium]|nr:BTAD domain-containing putative transcriptional regulator [Mycobacteriales bacterium]